MSVRVARRRVLVGAVIGALVTAGVVTAAAPSAVAQETPTIGAVAPSEVTVAGGSAAATSVRSASMAAATITKLSTTTGPTSGGTKLTIYGKRFSKVTQVWFGDQPATRFTVNSSKKLTVWSPPGAVGTVQVSVVGAYGTSPASTKARFSYRPAPTIATLTPDAGPTKGGTKVTITGTGFTKVRKVYFGTKVAAKLKVVSSTTLRVVAPRQSAGSVPVRVVTAYGTSEAVSVAPFGYLATPTVSSVSPSVGASSGSTEVTISGTNLSRASRVTFGGLRATRIVVISDTQLVATTPAHVAGTVRVQVSTPGGSSADRSASRFTYRAASHEATAIEAEVLTLTNQARSVARTCGGRLYPAVAPLAWDPALADLALAHSRDMAARDYFSHTNPDGQGLAKRMALAGYQFSAAGENIAAGYPTAAEVVAGWLASPGHCANLMSASYKVVGIGFDSGSGRYGSYWTQDFATAR